MDSDSIRTAFLDFFEEKGHKVIPSDSLIPHSDPTLLLTSAGMVQFKPYFLGEATPPNPRLTSCQKCFRTTDIELVGDTTHLTFFEMLGNFSIGDYFKREAISWAWEFVTRRLKLPPERLWVSIFLDDEESFTIWREIGIPEKRILRFGEEDNFWGPAGDSGPCGPCSEIYYDFGEDVGCRQPSCTPGCDCSRFSEIWNLVFTQYNQDKDGNRTLLPKPNIDTGMGLERIAAAMQGKTSVYETDLFAPLLECVSGLAKTVYGTDSYRDNAVRVISEHSRGIAFLIGDGVMPANEGRGYVLRRLLRRTALFGRRLGLDKPFITETAKTTIRHMEHIYPELTQRQDFILRVVQLEEARFGETLDTGLELLAGIMDEVSKNGERKISGRGAFRLYDTYGFPVELTTEIAAGRGFSVDMEGFEKEMEKQRERAKSSHKFVEQGKLTPQGFEVSGEGHGPEFTGYRDLCSITRIEYINYDKEGKLEQGEQGSIILTKTPFYGEMGGQVGDTGEIRSETGRFTVTDTVRAPQGIIVHHGYVIEGSLSTGQEIEAEVNRERRLDIARNHTATHLLQAALREVLGEHIQQRGSLVTPERFRFDFSHLVAMTREETGKIQRIVNGNIRRNLSVDDQEIPYKQALEEGAIALFDEKYGDTVRVLRIGQPPISTELCGGTHVTTTGEIGFFHIVSESSIGAGLRRIEAVTGRGFEEFINRRLADLEALAEYLESKPDGVLDRARSLTAELKNERRQVQSLQMQLVKKWAEDRVGHAEVINGVNVLAEKVDAAPMQILRATGDILKDKLGSGIIVLGTVYQDKPAFVAMVTPDLTARGYNAGEIIRQVAGVTGGGGGGKATLAQAGGRDKDKVDEALRLVKKLI